MIYLIKSEARNGTYFKVGYTKNWNTRSRAYITDCPGVVLLETVNTYAKSKCQLEVAIHKEITAMGYRFRGNYGTTTEWFFVPADKEAEFEANGLAQFKACRNRVITKYC